LSLPSLSNPIPRKAWAIYWNENIFRADIKSVFHERTPDDIAHPKYAHYAFILGVWDANAAVLPTVLVAWNNDEFNEEGARLVEPLALGEDRRRAKTKLLSFEELVLEVKTCCYA
jgi:hypothetical protein